MLIPYADASALQLTLFLVSELPIDISSIQIHANLYLYAILSLCDQGGQSTAVICAQTALASDHAIMANK